VNRSTFALGVKKMNGRRMFINSLVAVAGVVSYRWIFRNRLSFVNESGQNVSDLVISVGGEDFRFASVTPGGIVTIIFKVYHEERFKVDFLLADGTRVQESEGYVTWEESLFGIHARLVVKESGQLTFTH